ncbi:hypothetical protein VNO80_16384 [Phaseolus coccineus]|uniref:Uncharacterized protein n=1 Tax=Phaseolus coccineus TaxID=3886 RepID=A0AAN9MNF4_PHACN
MDTENLSFSKMCDTCVYSSDSPPTSPKASSNQVLREGSKVDEKEGFEAKLVSKGHRKSFSFVQSEKKMTRVDDEEIPMDLLWEVLNEELSSATKLSNCSSMEMVEFRCATVAKTSTALVQTKNRSGMVMMIKVFKKFFSLNNSQIKLFWQSD